MPTIEVPRLSLVVLAGPAGSGKSTFAHRHFAPTQVVSSDECRALVADDPGDQEASAAAFEVLQLLVDKRLGGGRLTVVDSTALTRAARADLLRLARRHQVPSLLIIFNVPVPLALRRDRQRERQAGRGPILRHAAHLRETLATASHEGFSRVVVLSAEEAEAAEVRIVPMPMEVGLPGPFDLVGDVHGCFDELTALLGRLGYRPAGEGFAHPEGRRLVFTGDLVDRGPDSVGVIKLAAAMTERQQALLAPGNHCHKLWRLLRGHQVQIGTGLERTLEQLATLPPAERGRVEIAFREMLDRAPPYLMLDHGRLVVAHAGIEEWMIGRLSRRIEAFVRHGEPTGEVTAAGAPVRRDWAREYRGRALVVYGHTPTPEPVIRHHTVNIDQGCVYGCRLTALRYPEREFVQVQAARAYYRAEGPDGRPLPADCLPSPLPGQGREPANSGDL